MTVVIGLGRGGQELLCGRDDVWVGGPNLVHRLSQNFFSRPKQEILDPKRDIPGDYWLTLGGPPAGASKNPGDRGTGGFRTLNLPLLDVTLYHSATETCWISVSFWVGAPERSSELFLVPSETFSLTAS